MSQFLKDNEVEEKVPVVLSQIKVSADSVNAKTFY